MAHTTGALHFSIKFLISSFVINLDSLQRDTMATLGMWEKPTYSTVFPFC